MTNKTTEALKLAEEALNAMLTHMGMDEDEWTKPTFNQAREALAAILEALANNSGDANEMVMDWSKVKPEAIKSDPMYQMGYAAAKAEPVKQEPVAVEQSAPYGFCPICRRAGVSRERGINGNDTCVIGHKYASSEAIPAEPVKQEPVAIVVEVDRHGDATVVSGAWQLDGGTHTFYAAPVQPVKQEPVAVISESAIGLVKLHSNGACLPFGTPLYAAPVQPVKQEPVSIPDHITCPFCESNHVPYWLHDLKLDAKAIRANAISGVACRVKALFDERGYDPTLEEELVTAIRGLK